MTALDRIGCSNGIGHSSSTGRSNGIEPFPCRNWKNPMADHLPMGSCPLLLCCGPWGHVHFHVPTQGFGGLCPHHPPPSTASGAHGASGVVPNCFGFSFRGVTSCCVEPKCWVGFSFQGGGFGVFILGENRKSSPKVPHETHPRNAVWGNISPPAG